jgi:hypothetical protein
MNPDDPNPIPPIVTGILRALLASGGGALTADGLASAQQVSTMEGAAMVLIAGAWSIYAHYRAHQKLTAAIAAPMGKATP